MKIRYYFSWFNDVFPEKLVRLLHEDITDRKSLVMISAQPSDYDEPEWDIAQKGWLGKANILFNEYHLIDYRMQKEEARRILKSASVIFLLGGDTLEQNGFLAEYKLSDFIKNSDAVIMGVSAGSENIAAKWFCSKNIGDEVEKSTIYDGIGFDDFFYLSHFELDNSALMDELLSMSQKMDIYAAEEESVIRIRDGKTNILGNVYFISNSKIQKLDETL